MSGEHHYHPHPALTCLVTMHPPPSPQPPPRSRSRTCGGTMVLEGAGPLQSEVELTPPPQVADLAAMLPGSLSGEAMGAMH